MSKTKFSIDLIHPKWGRVQLEAIRETEEQLHFSYPSGKFMGSWDREMGGGLGHPSEEVDRFLRTLPDGKSSLLDLDLAQYRVLEDLLEDEVRKHLPDFLIVPTREELRREREEMLARRDALLSTLVGCKSELLDLSPRGVIQVGLDSFSAYAYVDLPKYLAEAVGKLSEEDQESFSLFSQEYMERLESEGMGCIAEMKQGPDVAMSRAETIQTALQYVKSSSFSLSSQDIERLVRSLPENLYQELDRIVLSWWENSSTEEEQERVRHILTHG